MSGRGQAGAGSGHFPSGCAGLNAQGTTVQHAQAPAFQEFWTRAVLVGVEAAARNAIMNQLICSYAARHADDRWASS
jgi:hypothetical protein